MKCKKLEQKLFVIGEQWIISYYHKNVQGESITFDLCQILPS